MQQKGTPKPAALASNREVDDPRTRERVHQIARRVGVVGTPVVVAIFLVPPLCPHPAEVRQILVVIALGLAALGFAAAITAQMARDIGKPLPLPHLHIAAGGRHAKHPPARKPQRARQAPGTPPPEAPAAAPRGAEEDLPNALLPAVDLRHATLAGVQLGGSVLTGALLQGADLQDSGLRGARLVGADLRGAQLLGADLSGADIRDADLRGADLSGATLSPDALAGAITDETTKLPSGEERASS